MKCPTCNIEMLEAYLLGDGIINVTIVTAAERKSSRVECLVCPKCGRIELKAEKPHKLG